jgi:hypothetical protein
MSRRLTAALVVIVAPLWGCAPLQQAPLVYASKISMGIDVASSSTEQPGFGINIGYKQVDTAYVPVAVARECKSGEAKDCQGKSYELVQLNGDNKVADQVKPSDTALSDAQAKITAATTKVTASRSDLDQKQVDLVKMQANFDKAQANLAKVKAAAPPASDAAPGVPADVSTAQGTADQAAKDLDTAKQAKAAAEQGLQAAQSALADASANYSLIQRNQQASKNDRKDAYSVYGSFDGATKGDKAGTAALNLGRVFSTGVASQNLTEGVRASSCLQAATLLLDKGDGKADADTLKQLVQLCDTRATQPH